MPRPLAVVALIGGGAAAAFGIALPFIDTPDDEPSAAPRIALEPAVTADASSVRDEIHVLVRLPGGKPAAGVRVSLVPLFTEDAVKTLTERTDDRGRVAFDGIEVTPGTPYAAEARFDGTTFPSPVLRFGRSQDDPLRIVVADTTSDTEDISLDLESIAIVGGENGVQAIHAVTVRNRGERAYVGGLSLPMLPGANAIDPRGGLDRRYLELDDGKLLSKAPVTPGRHDITYTYIASLPRSGLRLTHRPSYDTERFEVLVGGEIAGADAQGLTEAGEVRVGPPGEERTYTRYEAEGVGRRDRLGLEISSRRSSPVLRVGALVVAILLALGLFAFPLVRRRRRVQPEPVTPEPVAAE